MAFRLQVLVWSFAVIFLFTSAVKCVGSEKKVHGEVVGAKRLLDELVLRLSLHLKFLHEKVQAASQTQTDSEQQAKVIRGDLRKIHRVQSLLGQLSGKTANPDLGAPCNAYFSFVDFQGRRPVRVQTRTSLPANYTVSFHVNHRALIDKGLGQSNGNDLRIFYQPNASKDSKEPIQIDRVISGLGTTNATISFKLQTSLPSDAVNQANYALIFGSKTAGQVMSNPEGVYLFHDDFADSNLNRKWKTMLGEWTVKNGKLFGKTGSTPTGDDVEIGIYAKDGLKWADYEVDLDFMETTASSKTEYPGPFLRVKNPSFKQTTAWWFEYQTNSKSCTMRPYNNNKDGSWLYRSTLPTPLSANKWFHFRYRVQGQTISQWVDGHVIHDEVAVANAWHIAHGTLGLGCHNAYAKGCRSFYDNIRVRLTVPFPPQVSLGDSCSIRHHTKYLLGGKHLPADSCKQIHDASVLDGRPLAHNGVYWIKTTLEGKTAVQMYCDIQNGGWTLVGKMNGRVGNIYDKWLVSNTGVKDLMDPRIRLANNFSCIDARVLAVHHASRIMFSSSGDVTSGIGSKWVQWDLPNDRKVATLWNHAVGYKVVDAASDNPVTVTAWNGGTKTCYQNKYGIVPLQVLGGSYPAATFNPQGNTQVNDFCMAVGVMRKGTTAHGWSQNGNGYDSPQADVTWPNRVYNHHSPHIAVWLK